MNAKRPVRRRSGRRTVTGRDFLLRSRSAGGFTLAEILLALALMAFFAALLIGGSRALAERPVSADDVFWKATSEARKLALQTEHETRLSFADDRDHGKRFIIADGTSTKEFPVVAKSDLGVNFLSAQKVAGSAVIVAGQVVETQSLPYVTFYGDGTCTAFRVQIRVGVDSHVLAIDPWTCAPVLVPPDKFGI